MNPRSVYPRLKPPENQTDLPQECDHMESPIFIFITICTILLIYNIVKIKKNKTTKLLVKNIGITIVIICLSYIWFVPYNIGMRGESPVCKFRLKVYLCEFHDYGGYGNFYDLFFKVKPNKYGDMKLYSKLGGWKEYFGFTQIFY